MGKEGAGRPRYSMARKIGIAFLVFVAICQVIGVIALTIWAVDIALLIVGTP